LFIVYVLSIVYVTLPPGIRPIAVGINNNKKKLVQTFADRGCRVVSATNPDDRFLGFLNRNRYSFFQVAPQLYSRG
jgi:hypothetical protein